MLFLAVSVTVSQLYRPARAWKKKLRCAVQGFGVLYQSASRAFAVCVTVSKVPLRRSLNLQRRTQIRTLKRLLFLSWQERASRAFAVCASRFPRSPLRRSLNLQRRTQIRTLKRLLFLSWQEADACKQHAGALIVGAVFEAG